MFAQIARLDTTTRRALMGVNGMFFGHGAMMSLRAAYIPVIKTQLAASDAQLAYCLTALGFGSLVAILFSSSLVARWGSAKVSFWSVVAAAVIFALQAVTTNLWLMVLNQFLLGAAVVICDIAMNVQASVVEQRTGASYMTRIHATWSAGALTGALIAGLVIERMSSLSFTVIFSLLSVVLAYVSAKTFVAEARGQAGATGFSLPPVALLPLSGMAFLALMTTGVIRDWTPIYLIEKLGSSLSFSVQAFAAFSITTAIGRVIGDGLRERFGDAPLLIVGGIIGCIAIAVGLLMQRAEIMFIAIAVLGLAHANVIPALISLAGKQSPGNEARNVTSVMGLGYTGFMLGPFLIGYLAEWKGLATGIAVAAIASLLIAAIGFGMRRSSN